MVRNASRGLRRIRKEKRGCVRDLQEDSLRGMEG